MIEDRKESDQERETKSNNQAFIYLKERERETTIHHADPLDPRTDEVVLDLMLASENREGTRVVGSVMYCKMAWQRGYMQGLMLITPASSELIPGP